MDILHKTPQWTDRARETHARTYSTHDSSSIMLIWRNGQTYTPSINVVLSTGKLGEPGCRVGKVCLDQSKLLVTLAEGRPVQRLGPRWMHTCGPQRTYPAPENLQSTRMHIHTASESWNLIHPWPQIELHNYKNVGPVKSQKKTLYFKINILNGMTLVSNWNEYPLSVCQHIMPCPLFKTPNCSNIAFVVKFYTYMCQM